MKITIEEEDQEAPRLPSIVDITDTEDDKEAEEVASCWICERPGVETSDFYCDVRYCGPEHRELHHPEDHDEPWPFIVKYKPGVGRLMVAAREIDQGELIFTEPCLAQGPNHTLFSPYCLDCLKKVPDTAACTKCGWPVCGEECETGQNHSIECKTLTDNKDNIDLEYMKSKGTLYWPISTLRILLLSKENPGSWSVIQRMMSHREEHRAKETWPMYDEHLVRMIRDKCGLGDMFSDEEVEHVSGVIDVNSIRLESHGHGVYMKTSIMSHSCTSNTKTIMNEDQTVDVRAVLPIKRGSEITKSYVSSLETTQLRQERLMDGWYFRCKCLRCCDPLEGLSFASSVACLKCKEGLILSTNPLDSDADWSCGDCGFMKTADAIKKLNEYFMAAIIAATDDCSGLEDLLEKSVKMFHPNHYLPTLTRIKLNTAFLKLGARNEGNAEVELLMRRKEFLDDVHQTVETIEPGLTQRRGLSLFERSVCHLQLGRELYDKKNFGKADFCKLLESEITSLEDCLDCLEHSSVGGYLDDVNFKAGAARDDAESWLSQVLEGSL
eukprot:TRINITY_DN12154_c0_g1_i1.p1 TRINITY_DN12154_c0_g1~~TRINITY_DN12154_c0_g1_i1.p1  ORF type:complete len:553 (-),score=159.07 TRINITY_DN12154_c0_g1_i1:57-1715(-)